MAFSRGDAGQQDRHSVAGTPSGEQRQKMVNPVVLMFSPTHWHQKMVTQLGLKNLVQFAGVVMESYSNHLDIRAGIPVVVPNGILEE